MFPLCSMMSYSYAQFLSCPQYICKIWTSELDRSGAGRKVSNWMPRQRERRGIRERKLHISQYAPICRNRRIWLALAREHEVRSAARWVFHAFDMVLGLAARAVDLLIQGARGTSLQAGDDEAGIAPQRPGLDAGDDPLDAVPACCAIIELFEPPDFLSRSLLRARRGAGLQRDDVFAQRRGRATPKM